MGLTFDTYPQDSWGRYGLPSPPMGCPLATLLMGIARALVERAAFVNVELSVPQVASIHSLLYFVDLYLEYPYDGKHAIAPQYLRCNLGDTPDIADAMSPPRWSRASLLEYAATITQTELVLPLDYNYYYRSIPLRIKDWIRQRYVAVNLLRYTCSTGFSSGIGIFPQMVSTSISIAASDGIYDDTGYVNLQNAIYNASIIQPDTPYPDFIVNFYRQYSYRPWQGSMPITPLVSLTTSNDAMTQKYNGCNAFAHLVVSRTSRAYFDTLGTGLQEGQNIFSLQNIDCALHEYPYLGGGTWKVAHILALPDISRTLVSGYFNNGFTYGMTISHDWIIFDLAPKLAFFDNLESFAS